MRFTPLCVAGAWRVEVEPAIDDRGLFARTFCEREFSERGLVSRFVQCATSHNRLRGTLRGLHFQSGEHSEAKLVRCTAGSAFDVLVDLRPGSPTFRKWVGVELDATHRAAVYAPKGVAHGFVTTSDGTEIFYHLSRFHEPAAARGVLWDDPVLGIDWPLQPRIMSARDRALPGLDAALEQEHGHGAARAR